MKKGWVVMLCSVLLAGCSSGPTAAELEADRAYNNRRLSQSKEDKEKELERGIAIAKRANKLKLEAEARAMEQCQTEHVVVSLPEWDWYTGTERTIDTTVSITWSGACVEGKRDGPGLLTWIEDTTTKNRVRMVQTNKAEGRFVKGQRLGLWCMTLVFQSQSTSDTIISATASTSGCSVFAGHEKPLTSNYRKQPDGSWMEYVAESATGSSLPPGTLEAQSAKVLADAAAGKQIQKPELSVHNKALDDLVRGSKIVLALSDAPISLQEKRVAIVLSSRTISELERFTRERQALISASSHLTGEAAKHRAEFIAASNPDRLLMNVAKTLRKHAKTVQPEDDLAGLQQGRFDYALILDWTYMTRFDLLGRYASFSAQSSPTAPDRNAAPACESLGGFLVAPNLKAVKQLIALPICSYEDKDEKDDVHYMRNLALFYEIQWGKGPDDIGVGVMRLDAVLKR